MNLGSTFFFFFPPASCWAPWSPERRRWRCSAPSGSSACPATAADSATCSIPHRPVVAYDAKPASYSTNTAFASRTTATPTKARSCPTPTTCSPSGWRCAPMSAPDRDGQHGPPGARWTRVSCAGTSAPTSCGRRGGGVSKNADKTRSQELGRLRRPRPRPRARLHEGRSGSTTRTCSSRRSGSPTPGPRRCPATSTCAPSPSTSRRGCAPPAGTPMEFNTVAISDGVTMGTQGMKASLVSREVIADSIELMARGYQFDAIVALCACDKTIPGCVMALARLDVPSVLLYGGSIAPGRWHGPRRHHPRHLRGDRRPRDGRHDRRGTARARGRRQPRRRRLRRPVHRQHDGLRLRGAWGSRPRARRWSPPKTTRSATVAERDRRAGHGGAGRGPAARARSSPATRWRTRSPAPRLGRLDQRRAAPARASPTSPGSS